MSDAMDADKIAIATKAIDKIDHTVSISVGISGLVAVLAFVAFGWAGEFAHWYGWLLALLGVAMTWRVACGILVALLIKPMRWILKKAAK